MNLDTNRPSTTYSLFKKYGVFEMNLVICYVDNNAIYILLCFVLIWLRNSICISYALYLLLNVIRTLKILSKRFCINFEIRLRNELKSMCVFKSCISCEQQWMLPRVHDPDYPVGCKVCIVTLIARHSLNKVDSIIYA